MTLIDGADGAAVSVVSGELKVRETLLNYFFINKVIHCVLELCCMIDVYMMRITEII
jgi:hypothetical protein